MIKLFERNPGNRAKIKQLQPRKTPTKILEDYLYNDPNPETLFITFTMIPKVGINPKSEYDTPNGIYCYPLSVIEPNDDVSWTEETPVGQRVPFAGNNPFIYLLRVKPETNYVKDIGDLTEADVLRYNKTLFQWFIDSYRNHPSNEGDQFSTKAKELWDSLLNRSRDYVQQKSQTSGGALLWALTRNVASSYGRLYGAHPPSVWNKIWRNVLGVKAIVDLGGGIIHYNEPTQAVFFEKTSFDVVEKIDNTDNPQREVRVTDGWSTRKSGYFTIKTYYRNGVQDGPALTYNSGKLVRRDIFKKGKLITTQTYHENGRIATEKRNDVTTSYDEDGKKLQIYKPGTYGFQYQFNDGILDYAKRLMEVPETGDMRDVVSRYSNGMLTSVAVYPMDSHYKSPVYASKVWKDGEYVYSFHEDLVFDQEEVRKFLDSFPVKASDVRIVTEKKNPKIKISESGVDEEENEYSSIQFGEEEIPLSDLKSIDDLQTHLLEISRIAQQVYDDWDEDDQDTYAGGGICHLIADPVSSYLWANGFPASQVSSNFEQHVYTVFVVQEGVYQLDIHYSHYETGGGFSWKKKPGVLFDSDIISIDRLDVDPRSVNQYIDCY